MIHRTLLAATILFLVSPLNAEDKVFSGPQVGEKPAPFTIVGVFDKQAGKKIDLVKQADGKPLVIVFVHKLTRPSIAMARAVMNFAARRANKGLVSGMVFLSDDRTAMETRVKRARRALPKGLLIGISPDGLEGPGAYGLNRKVTLTFVIAKNNKVTANFALVQPSVQSDALPVVKQIVAISGGGPLPKLSQLLPQRRRNGDRPRRLNRRQMARLEQLARTVIRKESTAAEVQTAMKQLDQFLRRLRAAARVQMATIAKNLKKNERFASLPKDVQNKLNIWSNFKYRRPNPREAALSQQLRPYISPVIKPDATPLQVLAAAERLELFVAKNEALKRQLGIICNRVKNLKYGTPAAQELIKLWAVKFGPKPAKKKGDKSKPESKKKKDGPKTKKE